MTVAYDERAREYNQQFAAKLRAESCLDKSIRLAPGANFARPILGPSHRQYYAAKHARGEYGTYFLHHGDDTKR